jgi:hypothetical protein
MERLTKEEESECIGGIRNEHEAALLQPLLFGWITQNPLDKENGW